MVVDMNAKRRVGKLPVLAAPYGREPEPFAPTATFRWAKSSPSAPPVLQQLWVNHDLADPKAEWRELDCVVLGDDPPSVEALNQICFGVAPKRCELCGRNVNIATCDGLPGCPEGVKP